MLKLYNEISQVFTMIATYGRLPCLSQLYDLQKTLGKNPDNK